MRLFEYYLLSSSGFYWSISVPTLLGVSFKTIISHHQVPIANMRVRTFVWPIPVATLSKVWVYCRSIPGTAGSNPSGIWMSVSCECCVLSGRRLCDGSITRRRGVLPSVVCLSVMQEPHTGGVEPLWLSSHDRKKKDLSIGLFEDYHQSPFRCSGL